MENWYEKQKKIIMLLLFVATPAFGGVGITVGQNGEIHCSGCRFKTIDGVKYVCTGSLSNERCTKRDEWVRNVKDTKSASKNNEDMSYLQKEMERIAREKAKK